MEQSRRQATGIRCLRILQQNLNCRSVKKKRCMDGGMSNAQIAENMGISLSTVKKHVYHIFEKVGVDTRAQLRNVLETYNSTKF